MKERIKNFIRNNSGVAAVEFAFIAPILLTLFIGIVDMGLYLNDKIKIEAAARASAEYLILTRDEAGVEGNIITPYYAGMSTPPHTIEVEMVCECEDGTVIECALEICPDADDYKRRYFDVNLTKTHSTLFVYPGFPESIELTGQAKLQLD